MNSHQVVMPLSAAGLGVVGLLTVPALLSFTKQLRSAAPKDNFYEDRDGKSSPEHVAAFSNRKPRGAMVTFAAVGVATAVALSVQANVDPATSNGSCLSTWLATASWGLILAQSISICAIHPPVLAHDLSFLTFCSSIVTLLVVLYQAFEAGSSISSRRDATLALRIVNVAAAAVTLLAAALVPRRPQVSYRDHAVNPEGSSSLLSRNTWSWIRPTIDLASRKGDLDTTDIPKPDHNARAAEVVADWDANPPRRKLLWSILYAYKGRLALQWVVIITRCILGLAPFWVMLQLISQLQERGGGGSPSPVLWGLVIALAVLSVAEQWLDGWVNYFSMTRVSIPMKAQLSALIFLKSLRRKNVKSADKPSTEPKKPESEDTAPALPEADASSAQPADASAVQDASPAPEVDGGQGQPKGKDKDQGETEDKDKAAGEPDAEDSLKSNQAVVNLVGIDTRRIANFAAMQYFIISSIGNLIVYSAFLIKLIGWFPFSMGLVGWALVLPFNVYFSKRYVSLSKDLMKVRDSKLSIINEALLGIRQIKFAALERGWEKRIMDLRENELKVTWTLFLSDVVLFGCWVTSPILLAAAALATYALVHGELTPSVAFVSITVFKALEITLSALPEVLTVAFDTVVSVNRIDTYLQGPEIKKTVSDGSDVAFEGASVAWPVDTDSANEEDRFVLRDLNLVFPAGELSIICGKTGTGKSLVLSALIGETDVLDGKVFMPPTAEPLERHDGKAHPANWILPGTVAYVAQSPWLESASLKDNILFGLPCDEARYAKVLDVCALRKDLEILTDGDRTELGANGINLSGGQKWRITLARAIYSRAEILVMDDIFSAVDAHVGRSIFEKCIGGDICKGRTRILVTHHVALVQPLAKFIVELGSGTVLYSGSKDDLVRDGTLEKIERDEALLVEPPTDDAGESSTAVSSGEATVPGTPAGETDGTAPEGDRPVGDAPVPDAKKFIQDEGREKGNVKRKVYLGYMKACGGLPEWIIYVLIYFTFEAGNVGRTWWVKMWTGDQGQQPMHIHSHDEYAYAHGFALQQGILRATGGPSVASESGNGKLAFYLSVYVGLSLASGAVGTSRFWWSFRMSIKASRIMFRRILFTVLRTRLRWLDTVPVGRILNRLTSDFEIIDQRLNMDMGILFWHIFTLLGVCVAAALVSAYILPLSLVLVAVSGLIGKKYLDAARPLRRLESNSKSPVFELYNGALSGISTLRAFQKTSAYVDTMYKNLDLWNSVSVYMWTVSRWMGFRMALVGATFTGFVGLIVIVSRSVDAAMAGFTLSFALDFSSSISMAIRAYSGLELDMNAAERVIEYSELETEPQDGAEPPAAWPTSGRMEVSELEVAYADDLPPVLKGINFEVKDNERIGVVGRTGAGKSSLTLALFRFLEARSGTVTIDGLDISKLDLHSLRSRLAIIPQDPVLFSGTIRSNLDPFDNLSDDELRECLARVHLVDSSSPTPAEPSSAATSTLAPRNVNVFRDLSSPVSESGGNLSQGQRQLLCLARAIVSRPKLMVLDEATSAVDMATDALIQRSIREEFSDSTLIVIAHRLSTIVDFDRILVLSDGKAAEFGTPRELWATEGGIFRDMCDKSGEKGKLEATIFSKAA